MDNIIEWKRLVVFSNEDKKNSRGSSRKRLGSDVVACSLHPGVIETELWRHNSLDNKPFGANKTVAMGALLITIGFCVGSIAHLMTLAISRTFARRDASR